MDQYLSNRQKEVLLRLLANPADSGGAYLSNLQELVKLHAQSGLFRALYGRALNETTPLVAGAYFDSRALHKLLYHHDNIAPISNEQVVMQPDGKLFSAPAAPATEEFSFVSEAKIAEVEEAVNTVLTDHPVEFPDVLKAHEPVDDTVIAEAEPVAEPATDFAEPVEVPLEETLPEHKEEETPAVAEVVEAPFEPAPWEVPHTEPAPQAATEEDEEPLGRAPWELDEDDEDETPATAPQPEPAYFEPVAAEPEPVVEHQEEPAVAEHQIDDELASKLAYWATLEDEYDAPAAQVPAQQEPVQVQPETPINDEVYNEITSIDDIGLAQINTAPAEKEKNKPDEEERLILGNIAATDFFRFDKAFGDSSTRNVPEVEQKAAPENTPAPRPQPEPAKPLEEKKSAQSDVSNYHDDKMPYTFMWWLDKTRREHGSLYQPYTKAPVSRPTNEVPSNDTPAKTRPDELQQQYFENIFHLSSAEDFVPDAAQTVEFDMQSKEDRIIQRFITEDPQIHPPVGEKLDTENKAKKSSEDGYEMVTETLARIYADQMLFPKAIATYKKLMLKYPEKSRYFASRIENLEKRTN